MCLEANRSRTGLNLVLRREHAYSLFAQPSIPTRKPNVFSSAMSEVSRGNDAML
jgi:hypothetical protein